MNASEEERAFAAEHMKRITAAHSFLIDPYNWPEDEFEDAWEDDEVEAEQNEAADSSQSPQTVVKETPILPSDGTHRTPWRNFVVFLLIISSLAGFGIYRENVQKAATLPQTSAAKVPADATPIATPEPTSEVSEQKESLYLSALDQPRDDLYKVQAKYRIAARRNRSSASEAQFKIEQGSTFGVTFSDDYDWLIVPHGEREGYILRKQVKFIAGGEPMDNPAVDSEGNVPRSNEPPSSPQPSTADGYWTIGSTRAEISKVQGTPTSESSRTLWYEYDNVDLEKGVAVGFSNGGGRLKVKIPTEKATQATWRIGSTVEEVIAIQGTPTGFSRRTLWYEYDNVDIEDGVVTGYSNSGGNLKVGN